MTFLQAIVIGVVQGVSELFPVSSLGHTVLIPALIGGSWARLVTQEASPESPYLAFVVGLHVATAVALIIFFWREWARIVVAFFRTLAHRRIETSDERLAWLIILATIPVGLLGVLLEHRLRVLFAVPVAAAGFLTLNGVMLLVGGRERRRTRTSPDQRSPANQVLVALGPEDGQGAEDPATTGAATVVPAGETGAIVRGSGVIRLADAIVIGIAQVGALLAGFSRDGICMVAGLRRGLSYQDAARFAFLLSAPPIFAAGVLKIPDLMGPLGHGIRPQILVGSLAAFVTALLSVRFLVRYFRTGSLRPFGIYCLVFGIACLVRFGVF